MEKIGAETEQRMTMEANRRLAEQAEELRAEADRRTEAATDSVRRETEQRFRAEIEQLTTSWRASGPRGRTSSRRRSAAASADERAAEAENARLDAEVDAAPPPPCGSAASPGA